VCRFFSYYVLYKVVIFSYWVYGGKGGCVDKVLSGNWVKKEGG